MKKQLAEDMVGFISPIRARVDALLADEAYLQHVMKEGAAKARASAQETMQLVRAAIGLKYY
jgi:tryptophanyl-tRNA synthetase